MNDQQVKILTIDDDAFLCDTVCGYLEEEGFLTLQAQTGPEGLELLGREYPDVVLLDIRMPKMSGPEVLNVITRDHPDIPVIVISSTNNMDDVIQVLKLGAWDYINKPIIDLELLLHSVVRASEQARLVRENRIGQEQLEDRVRQQTIKLAETNRSLAQANVVLERKHVALQEVLDSVQAEKSEVERRIAKNIQEIILPMLQAHRKSLLPSQQSVVDQILQDLLGITGSGAHAVPVELADLTVTELRISRYIYKGLSSKEISDLEHVAVATVKKHRERIRKKLGLTETKANLAATLARYWYHVK